MSRNAISANPEHYIFKIRLKTIFLTAAWLKNFFSGSTPPPPPTLNLSKIRKINLIFSFVESRI